MADAQPDQHLTPEDRKRLRQDTLRAMRVLAEALEQAGPDRSRR